MTEALATRWLWCYRPWPVDASDLVVGSPAWIFHDKRVPRLLLEATDSDWATFCGSLQQKGFVPREVFRLDGNGKPEAVAW